MLPGDFVKAIDGIVIKYHSTISRGYLLGGIVSESGVRIAALEDLVGLCSLYFWLVQVLSQIEPIYCTPLRQRKFRISARPNTRGMHPSGNVLKAAGKQYTWNKNDFSLGNHIGD